MVWVLVILHDFHPVTDLDLIDHGPHCWAVAREVIKGGVAGCCVNAFIFAGLNDLNNVVLARLLRLQVNTQELSGDAGAGISVRFGKAFFVVEIVVVPTV